MAKNSLMDEVDLPALKAAMDKDYLALEVFRTNLVNHVREFCGPNYSSNGTVKEKPFNLISLFVRIITDYLVGSEPRMMATTFTRELRPYASAMEGSINRKMSKMRFSDILRTAITDSLFLMGVVRTALTAPAESRFGYGKSVGERSMDNINFEDMIFDTRSKKFHEVDYIGHFYDVCYDDVKASGLFDKKEKLKLVPRDDTTLTPTGDEKIGEIGRGGMASHDEYDKKVRLGEIWLRRKNLIVTFDAKGDFERPLLVQKWVGPECGPYRILTMGSVPGNLMPKAPVMDLIAVDRSFNMLHCKLDNQAERAKVNPVYKDDGFASRWEKAKDGVPIQSDFPDAIQELKTGGPDERVANWAIMSYNLFSEYAGNLKSLGGLASQSDTATQEKLVHQSASNLVEAMGGRVLAFAQDLMTGLGWFDWNSPRETFKTSFTVPGVPDVGIDRTVTPQQRFGIPFEEIDIQIDPYSLIRQTPAMRVRALDEMVQGVILKALPMFNQPGIADLLAEYIRLKSKYTNNPDLIVLLEKLQGVQGPPAGQEAQPQQPGMDSETTRNYVRTSQPGMSDQGHMQVLQQLMSGGKPPDGAQGGGLGQMSQRAG